MSAKSVTLIASLKGADGKEYSISNPRVVSTAGTIPTTNVQSLTHKRVLENQANTVQLTVVDSTAYDIENYLMTMSKDMTDRLLYFQYGYTGTDNVSNLSRVYRSMIYRYTPTIAGSTTSLTIEAVSAEPNGSKRTHSTSYGKKSSSGPASSLARNSDKSITSLVGTSTIVAFLNTKFNTYPDSVMRNRGADFVSTCNKYGVNPILAASISVHETGWWRSPMAKNNNNIGGMRTSAGWMVFSSITEGIDRFVKNLKDLYYDYGLTTVETIGPKYCVPPDTWITNVNWFVKKWTDEIATKDNIQASKFPGVGGVGHPPLQLPVLPDQNNHPMIISDIVKVLCERNGWKIGDIEETQDIGFTLTQYNTTDLEFIKTKLRPLAVSKATGERGYVFYLTNIGDSVYANFNIPRTSDSPSKAYMVDLNESGGITSSDILYDTVPNSIYGIGGPGTGHTSGSFGSDITKSSRSITKTLNSKYSITGASVGKTLSGNQYRYGTPTSYIKSWSPSIPGAYLLSQASDQDEYTIMNETGDEIREKAVESVSDSDQYDSRNLLGSSVTSTIRRSGSFNSFDSGSKSSLAWANASKYMFQCTCEMMGDHTINFRDTIDFNIYLQGKLHYTSGRYLVTEVTDTINSGGFTTSLRLLKNAKVGEEVGYDKSSDINGNTKARDNDRLKTIERRLQANDKQRSGRSSVFSNTSRQPNVLSAYSTRIKPRKRK